MSKDKYPSIFSRQMETIVYVFPSLSWRIFGHVTCLDQSRASEKVWWIVTVIFDESAARVNHASPIEIESE